MFRTKFKFLSGDHCQILGETKRASRENKKLSRRSDESLQLINFHFTLLYEFFLYTSNL